MRFTGYRTLGTVMGAAVMGTALLAPLPASAASKEMMDLQRDVADLQGQVTDMQKELDTKLASMQTLVQQALDTANKTSGSVTGLSGAVTQTLRSELKGISDQLSSVTGVSVKVDNISQDVSDMNNKVQSMQVSINRMQQQLTDVANQVKLIQAPPAPPPGTDTSSAAPGQAAPAVAPQPSPQTVFDNAQKDQNSGNAELAVSEYMQFLRLYPNDPNAIRAQFNIGDIYYSQSRWDDALKALNAAIEQYDKDPETTPSAYYMKGLVLKQQKKTVQAKATFEDVIKQFPASPYAKQARTQLATLGGGASRKK